MISKKVIIPVAVGALALSVVGGVGISQALQRDNIVLYVDGAPKKLSVRAGTVGEVLASEHISYNEHDVLEPKAETKIVNGLEIALIHGKELLLNVDGVKMTRWTTASNVGDALAQLNLGDQNNKISTSRSETISRSGLRIDITTAKGVFVDAAGEAKKTTSVGTVRDALKSLGIVPDADDIVTPGLDTQVAEGEKITYVKMEKTTVTKEEAVSFKKVSKSTYDIPAGKSKVSTSGVNGIAANTYEYVYKNGKLVKTNLLSSKVTKSPVDEVTLVGKNAPTPSSPATSSSSSATPSKPANLTPASGATCKASYYWEGQMTASGERFNPSDMTAAHKSLPLGTRVKVTNLNNGQTTVVRINDRGPYVAGRCLDLSAAAMKAVGGTGSGVIPVSYQVV